MPSEYDEIKSPKFKADIAEAIRIFFKVLVDAGLTKRAAQKVIMEAYVPLTVKYRDFRHTPVREIIEEEIRSMGRTNSEIDYDDGRSTMHLAAAVPSIGRMFDHRDRPDYWRKRAALFICDLLEAVGADEQMLRDARTDMLRGTGPDAEEE